eukprot:5390778-Lingulodinium_polyedra.AAC.1
MTRSNRPRAATTARKSHAAHTPREHQNWHSHGVRDAHALRAAVATDGRIDRSPPQRLANRT